ncbi:MAG: hypothetical protein E6L07_06310 [Verrucomicrobia bacterium]|nr:MAG: hypothetical protein E6L07_06310 [Verrucomicrobiota bacterium]
MRRFLVLICSLALACVALGEEQGKKKEEKPKKKGAQAGQVSEPTGKAAGKPTGTGKPEKVGKATGAGKPTGTGKPTGAGKPEKVGKATGAGKPAEVGKATGAGKAVAAGTKVKPQHFNLANKPKPEVAPAVTFQQNRHIEGSQNWQGSNYTVFRNYSSEWHDQGWWRQRYNRIVVIGGGAYYWNAGYWYPAWGYDQANSYYPYDGPIYGYNDLPPDQVIANVQSALQQQGYYHGEVDGLLGPLTRAAVADYQRANGLVETAAIDQPTLESLGMS